jgi:hypothetical protein
MLGDQQVYSKRQLAFHQIKHGTRNKLRTRGRRFNSRSQAWTSAPTSLPRELVVVLFFMKSTRPAVDPRGYIAGERRASLRVCAHHSSAVFDQVVSLERERARGYSVSIPRTSLVFSEPFSTRETSFSCKGFRDSSPTKGLKTITPRVEGSAL